MSTIAIYEYAQCLRLESRQIDNIETAPSLCVRAKPEDARGKRMLSVGFAYTGRKSALRQAKKLFPPQIGLGGFLLSIDTRLHGPKWEPQQT